MSGSEGEAPAGSAMGEGFKRGFGGCFGVLAAIVLVVIALVVVAGINAERVDDRVMAGTAEARDYLPYCTLGAIKAASEDRNMRGASPIIGADPSTSYNDRVGLLVNCPVRANRGAGVVRISIVCAIPTETSCVKVVAAALD